MKILIRLMPAATAPIQDLNELLLIKGITPQIYNDSEDAPGMAGFMTVHGMTWEQGTTLSAGRDELTLTRLMYR